MKTLKMMTLFLTILVSTIAAHASDYKVVFELTSDSQKRWETILNNVENVKRELGSKTQMEVVAHGNGIDLFLKKSDFQKERILKLSKEGIKFLGCENTMKRKGIKPDELYHFVGTVPAGLAEIIRKQKEGWAYIKVGP
jgi:uncharacterized protein